ncbi:MAG: type II toxin-antitoxin system prevent-host-death family antitoxin [Treponema sp.]|nr:type II toxin-antitoxin system prevent-host-death family antitoxin [Treponema sp.]
MNAVTYSDLEQNLESYVDKVFQDKAPLIIARKNSENVVLLSIDEYDSLRETGYLLSSRANAEHLERSISQHKSGNVKTRL